MVASESGGFGRLKSTLLVGRPPCWHPPVARAKPGHPLWAGLSSAGCTRCGRRRYRPRTSLPCSYTRSTGIPAPASASRSACSCAPITAASSWNAATPAWSPSPWQLQDLGGEVARHLLHALELDAVGARLRVVGESTSLTKEVEPHQVSATMRARKTEADRPEHAGKEGDVVVHQVGVGQLTFNVQFGDHVQPEHVGLALLEPRRLFPKRLTHRFRAVDRVLDTQPRAPPRGTWCWQRTHRTLRAGADLRRARRRRSAPRWRRTSLA